MHSMTYQADYINHLTQELLRVLGNIRPSRIQISLMKDLVGKVAIDQHLLFNNKLTPREISCLYFTALGKTSEETAKLLGIKKTTVHSHRSEIKRKLGCNNMAHAVFKGMKMALLPPLCDP